MLENDGAKRATSGAKAGGWERKVPSRGPRGPKTPRSSTVSWTRHQTTVFWEHHKSTHFSIVIRSKWVARTLELGEPTRLTDGCGKSPNPGLADEWLRNLGFGVDCWSLNQQDYGAMEAPVGSHYEMAS
jgi:hypothetical protein